MKFTPDIGTGLKFDTIYFENRYFQRNDKQKTSKSVKYEFYANQICHYFEVILSWQCLHLGPFIIIMRLLVIRGTTERGTAEGETAERDFFLFFLLLLLLFVLFYYYYYFFFKQKKNNNNKEKVNISHKIKSMHIFFILRGRSRARLSSSFRVRISRRSVTALRTCSPQSKQ